MSEYHCPNCGKPVSFGESICPNCKADVNSLWEQTTPQKQTPKVAPGMGGLANEGASPFPPANNVASPFPPANNAASPFPPANNVASPFPPANNAASPFPTQSPSPSSNPPGVGTSNSGGATPFPSPAGSVPSPFPPKSNSAPAPFPPQVSSPSAPVQPTSGPHLEIPRIGGNLYIPMDQASFHIGRDEIQGCATKALPDLNAYKNISRVRQNSSGVYSEHLILHINQNQISIEDKHSTNGTYLGTTKLKGLPPQLLKEGDKIILPIEEHGKMVQLELFFRNS